MYRLATVLGLATTIHTPQGLSVVPAKPQGADIVKLSQCANTAASMSTLFFIKELPGVNWLWTRVMQKYAKTLHDRSYNVVNTFDVFSPVKIAKLDYLIIPGCVLTVPFFAGYGKLLETKVEQGCKLIFWAASGNHYTEYEIKAVKEWLRKLRPYAITTRDSQAFEYYSDLTPNAYNGIDNVFFVNKLNLPKVDTVLDPYIVLNFDEPKHKNIKENLKKTFIDKNIVYTDHKPMPLSKVSRMVKKGVVCSDYPLDYLFIYNNAKETHSDRVHACIPTLSFGNRAQLYSDSPRIALFENVGLDISEMKSHPVSIEQTKLKDLQDKQIEFLKSILK